MSQGLEQVLAKMLARVPADRFQMPADVVAALKPFCQEVAVKGGVPDWASQQLGVKAGIPSAVSNKYGVADKGSGKLTAAAKKQPRTAPPSPFANLVLEAKSSGSLNVAKAKGRAAGSKGLIVALGIACAVAMVVLAVSAVWMLSPRWFNENRKDDPKFAQGGDKDPESESRVETRDQTGAETGNQARSKAGDQTRAGSEGAGKKGAIRPQIP